MRLAAIIERFEGRDMPDEIRRKSWLEDGEYKYRCVPSSGGFYTDRNWDQKFEFTNDDITADDWEYTEVIWRSK